jgi:hypothetical protein
MDELELLKKDWKKDTVAFKNYSDTDIYPMLHKKSSSIVKTLFYISIAEFVFWLLINLIPFFLSDTYKDRMNESYENPIFMGITMFGFLVIFTFMYLLFRSHKAISAIDNAKKLMESILKTRRIIKYYVLYNLFVIFISIPLSLYFEFNQNPVFHDHVESMNSSQKITMYTITILVTGLFILLFWLFYKVIYGILLKRLNRNYKELKKLEV